MKITLNNLGEAKTILNELKEKEHLHGTNWNPYKIFAHCAKTIDYSMKGYPKMKPVIIRASIGKIAFSKFMNQGYMQHNLTADVPGSPEIHDNDNATEGIDMLLKAIDTFQHYGEKLKPHLLFGNLQKEEYDKYFAMHIADHLSELNV